ncbi:MAG TPA: hypothetical protein EYP54_06160, partial [Anaerolineales bacterium]|nr:hypothetical protein [Anaerolineales bacterium]
MKTRVLFVLAGVLLLSLACSFSIGVGSTPTPIPPTATPIPSPTPLPPPPTPLPPTALPSTSESTSSSAPFLLTANTYEHPQGLFSLKIPQRWSMVDEMDYGASFAPDDEIGFLQVTATNTIYPLQGDALLQFAKSIEQAFETYDGYQLLSQKSGNQVVIMERVVTYQGVPQRVRTYFLANDATVLSLDFWADADVADAYFRFYEKWLDHIFYHTNAMAQLPPYADTWAYTAPDNLFQMEAPIAWYYSYDQGNNAVLVR